MRGQYDPYYMASVASMNKGEEDMAPDLKCEPARMAERLDLSSKADGFQVSGDRCTALRGNQPRFASFA